VRQRYPSNSDPTASARSRDELRFGKEKLVRDVDELLLGRTNLLHRAKLGPTWQL